MKFRLVIKEIYKATRTWLSWDFAWSRAGLILCQSHLNDKDDEIWQDSISYIFFSSHRINEEWSSTLFDINLNKNYTLFNCCFNTNFVQTNMKYVSKIIFNCFINFWDFFYMYLCSAIRLRFFWIRNIRVLWGSIPEFWFHTFKEHCREKD